MSKKLFTDKEISILADNPFTYKVTTTQISFTAEFKRLYWEDYQQWMSPSKIFEKYGYDPEMLGRSRVTGFQQKIKREAEGDFGFHEGYMPRGTRGELSSNDGPYVKTIREMNHRIEYLEQEIDFFKKISSGKNTRK